ncbi:MAG TPA: hypothetical protein PKE27_16340 [Povalibacter sp.]|uniref:hypothetical protein n=1 Tax=Povalibacter sp. TaxID=1962978 RepID=UPI002C942F58|nr:hypothetical protein [Povalibacter sp.]HMN46149.1 hypothetical protein [Povalibacter sp.]
MSARVRLEQYLGELRRRIRTLIYVRAAAVAAGSAFLLVLALVWWLQRDGFGADLVAGGRIALIVIVASLALLLTLLPLRRLRRDDGAHEFERRLPAQGGRLQTYLDAQRRETQEGPSPLTELLAADALKAERATPARAAISDTRLWTHAGIVAAVLMGLACLLLIGPSYWGYGSRHLLLGSAVPREAVPLRRIAVAPGDVTVRRNSDLTIRAAVEGFDPEHAQVMVRFDDQPTWERAPMQAVQDGDAVRWEFKLFALRAPLHYYVTAQDRRGEERSHEHSVGVVDLPKIERVRLTYRYPRWTDLAPRTEDVSRDIRAVADTQVDIEVFASAPLESPVLVIDGRTADMKSTARGSTGTLEVTQPGSYHIGARVMDELVTLTDDYRIEIIEDQKPTIEIRKPGRDWRATSIEEVPVAVQAQDDFRLQQVELRYSVNGGEERTRRIASGQKQADVESLLRMEELGQEQRRESGDELLSPGDLVSYYAVAKDRSQSVETDLFVVQVQPFERRFSEGQGGGGGGGGDANEQGAISERQREILLATWNTQRSMRTNARSRSQLEDSAKMLSELQVTLATQARTLAERTRARGGVDQDERIARFVESLDRAAAVMDPAAKHLSDFKLDDAIPLEQQALQQLLRAESAFRDVQVAMQRDQARGGGQQAARNFTEMFELEMDVDKNHYETESSLSQRNESDELDEAIRKLKELAERQERLAQQNRQNQSMREQRWQQEQLRREAEDLRRRLAELQRSQQSQQEQSQNGEAGERSEQGSRSAMESMRQALEDMQAANSTAGDDRESAGRSAAEAGRNLRRALERMQQPRGESLAEELNQLAERAEKLVNEQREVEADLYDALGDAMASSQQRGQLAPERSRKLVESKQRMADAVGGIQQDMRAAMNDHGSRNPDAARRLGEALGELEAANLKHRLERSAMEVRYGRARDAAPREGLIADALDVLESNLRVVAQIAASERETSQEGADPQRLLAELGELRRALREAGGAGESPRGQSSQSGEAQNGEAQSGEGGPSPRTSGLTAWNPGATSAPLEDGSGQFRSREAAEIAQRIEDMATRAQGLNLSAADIQALRRMAREARGLNGRALADRLAAVTQLVDRLELATLASLEKSRSAPSAHTSAAIPDSPEYREAVAEYYRRLGGACTNSEGARGC